MRLVDYLDKALWSQNELAKQASISNNSVARAVRGERITRDTALRIAEALSKRFGKIIDGDAIDGLNIQGIRQRRKKSSAASTTPLPQTPQGKQKTKIEPSLGA